MRPSRKAAQGDRRGFGGQPRALHIRIGFDRRMNDATRGIAQQNLGGRDFEVEGMHGKLGFNFESGRSNRQSLGEATWFEICLRLRRKPKSPPQQ